MAVTVYLSQADIANLLGVDRTLVNVWRKRYSDWPQEDARTGLGKRSAPGWLPGRMDEIKAYVKAKGLKAPNLG